MLIRKPLNRRFLVRIRIGVHHVPIHYIAVPAGLNHAILKWWLEEPYLDLHLGVVETLMVQASVQSDAQLAENDPNSGR